MLGRTSRERAAAIRRVRAELAPPHGRFVDDLSLLRLYGVVGDAGLVADAVRMFPRPRWVERLVGPFPASLELSNPEDTASIEEWGAGGVGT